MCYPIINLISNKIKFFLSCNNICIFFYIILHSNFKIINNVFKIILSSLIFSLIQFHFCHSIKIKLLNWYFYILLFTLISMFRINFFKNLLFYFYYSMQYTSSKCWILELSNRVRWFYIFFLQFIKNMQISLLINRINGIE